LAHFFAGSKTPFWYGKGLYHVKKAEKTAEA
jgi:hypothetical protein